jgi:outer membrane protein assembly factor BamB
MTTIELGDVSSPGYEPTPRGWRGPGRGVAVAVTVLVTLVTVAGSVRPPPSGLSLLWTTPMSEADGVMLGTDAVYVNRNTTGTSRVTAYDLVTGAERWEKWETQTNGDLQLIEQAGLVLLTTDVIDQELRSRRETLALDARTGRRLWVADGLIGGVHGTDALMADYTTVGTPYRLRMIRLADRSVIWARDTPDLHLFSVAGDRLITATVDGVVEILRLADGLRLAGGQVRWVKPDAEANQFDDLFIVGDDLVLTRNWQRNGDITVYRLDTMAERWRLPDLANGYAFVCGPALCVCRGALLTAYHLTTGARLWQVAGIDNPFAATDDRIIVDRGNEGLLMIDPTTGAGIGTRVRGGTTVWNLDPDGDVFVLHPTSSPPNRTSVTRWDVATGSSRILGTLDLLTGYRCQTRGGYLACNRDSQLEVTALR